MSDFEVTMGLRKLSGSCEREANMTVGMDIVVVAGLLKVDGMTPMSSMKDVFLLIMLACV